MKKEERTFARRFTEPKVAKSNGTGPPKKRAKKNNGLPAPKEEEAAEEVKVEEVKAEEAKVED